MGGSREMARQTDDLIGRIDATMARMEALTARLNAHATRIDARINDEENDDRHGRRP